MANKEVKIGKKIWAAENLSLISFINGDNIALAKNKEEWKKFCDMKIPACAYLNFKNKATRDGVFYNIFSVIDIRGIIPKGWTLPTTKDWDSLARAVGGKKTAGDALKMKDKWNNANSSVLGSSNFSALPSGQIDTNKDNPDFSLVGSLAFWWSNDIEINEFTKAYISEYSTKLLNAPIIGDNYNIKEYSGINIRCIKDE